LASLYPNPSAWFSYLLQSFNTGLSRQLPDSSDSTVRWTAIRDFPMRTRERLLFPFGIRGYAQTFFSKFASLDTPTEVEILLGSCSVGLDHFPIELQ
jgi:hypothetical protein